MKKEIGIHHVLSVTGSDNTGAAGVQADIKTISALGGYASTAITSVAVQNSNGILSLYPLPTDVIVGQVRAVIDDLHPDAVKIGMIRGPETIKGVRDEIVGCRIIVCDPGIISSNGVRLMDDESLKAFCRFLVPETTVLVLKCAEAEVMLGRKVLTADDMRQAALELCKMGAKWVLLRGGHLTEGRLSALLFGDGVCQFFSSYNVDGWERHGVRGAMSTAIAACMCSSDDIAQAISKAHEYMHTQVVYSIEKESVNARPPELYNKFLSLIVQCHNEAHDVTFYAEKLSITTRYLSQITRNVVGKTPLQVIAEYLMQEAKVLLATSTMTVQEVSYKLGFSSQAMFTRFFRNHTGVTPSEYRS